MIRISKINIDMEIKTNDEIVSKKIVGLKKENKIIYNDDDNIITIFLKDNKIVLTKTNKEYKITINFIEGKITDASYKIFDYNKVMTLKIETLKIKVSNNELYVYYIVDNNTHVNYLIKYEVIL